ncbi:MAG: hypothetical protein Q7U82_08950 [Gammaproteobacteria bacterium]|nr:hypothetical protein [Gammaproteobacteria bacterium]
MKLIEEAPDQVSVLEVSLKRSTPIGYGGSLADTLMTRLRLFETLKQHPRVEVAAWAWRRQAEYAAKIELQRDYEATNDRKRDQSFE